MNAFKFLRILLLTVSFLVVACPARATYEEQLAQQAELKNQIKSLEAHGKALQGLQIKYLSKGNLQVVGEAEKQMKVNEKALSQVQRKLQGVEAKITKSRNAMIQEHAREVAREASQKAAIAAAKSAASEGAKNAAKDLAKNASKDSAKTASKDSNKGSSQDAAKSAVHPPVPVCKPSH